MIKAKDFLKDAAIYYSNNFIIDPEISIILPTYCRGDNGLLERAIKSVLKQSFSNFELIIVDDGSIDKTREVVEAFMKDDNRILYIRNDINSGLPAIRVNQGIKESRGKYIAYQFDDDEWYTNFLESLHRVISGKRECCVVYGKADLINMFNHAKDVFKSEPDEKLLNTRNLIANSSVLHHKEICEKYGMYDMHIFMKTGCDWDLWRRWIKEVKFYFVDKLVCKIESFHDNSIGKTCAYKKYLYDVVANNDRNEKLTLRNYEEYEVDSYEFIEDEAMREVAYQHYILPFRLKHIEIIPESIRYSIYSSYNDKNLILEEELYNEVKSIKNILGNQGCIGYIPHSGYLGGAEYHLLRHAVLSKEYGLNVVVFLKTEWVNKECDVCKICRDKNISVYYINYNYYTTPNNILGSAEEEIGKNLLKVFEGSNIKMLHSCTLIPSLKVAANELKIPYVASLYALMVDNINISKEKKKKYMPDVIHSDSVIYANKWSEDIGTYSKCIRTWVPNSFFDNTKEVKFDNRSLKVIISGTLQERKGQLEAIEALGILKNEGIEMNLKIIGYDFFYEEYKNKCISVVEKYGLQDKVEFVGFINDVEQGIDDGDILICASTLESFPQVILEAMAKKLAIVSTPVGGVTEIIKDNFSGYLCNGYTARELANGLRRAYNDFNNDNVKFNNIVENAFTIIKNECTEKRVAYELMLLYKTAFSDKVQELYGTCLDIINYKLQPVVLKNFRENGKGEINKGKNFEYTKRYVPQNLGLKASRKIKNNKAYVIELDGKIDTLSVYFGTHNTVPEGVMLVSINDNYKNIRKEYKYDLSTVNDNYEFIIELNEYIEKSTKLIVRFNLVYFNKNSELSLYEKKRK